MSIVFYFIKIVSFGNNRHHVSGPCPITIYIQGVAIYCISQSLTYSVKSWIYNSNTMRPFVKAKVDFFSSERKENYVHSLPELIDFNAVHNPDHLFCVQARSNEPPINVTNAQFKLAVDQCAQWIATNVKLPTAATKNGLAERPPVALLMESDFGLIVHQFALVSMGIPVCSPPPSPCSYSTYLKL